MTRKEFIGTVAAAGVAAASAESPLKAQTAPGKPKLGVTIYSYTPDIQSGRMTLESCIADVADLGAEGVEILGESHIPDYPNPSPSWVKQWFAWMDKYHLKPAAYDTFVDTMFYRHRSLTPDEAAARLAVDFKLANMLGFKTLRQQWPPYPADNKEDEVNAPYVKSQRATDTILKALPAAEKYDVKMGIELHSPTHLKSAFIESMVELIEKTKTKHFGFTPDLSSFTKRPPRKSAMGSTADMIRQGARQNLLDYIVEAYQQKLGPEKTVAEVKKMGGNELELNYAGIAGVYHFSYNDPKDLAPLVPYVYHVHAKFYEMTEDLHEYSIPYDEVIAVLVQGGYNGYLDSEYEGGRQEWTTSASIRAQHAMLRKLLGRG